jgi:predicted nucleic acid-binding protein
MPIELIDRPAENDSPGLASRQIWHDRAPFILYALTGFTGLSRSASYSSALQSRADHLRTQRSWIDLRLAGPLFPANLEVAREYGRLRQRLQAKGRPLPENDIWIAATATYHQLVLVTRDRHSHDVDELIVAEW